MTMRAVARMDPVRNKIKKIKAPSYVGVNGEVVDVWRDVKQK
jgi:hypothetical protein